MGAAGHPLSAVVESLESRTLFTSTFPNFNTTQLMSNGAEGAIAVDRANPADVFAVSSIRPGGGLAIAQSSDGGTTWTRQVLGDELPPSLGDPSATFDSYGNLFLTYLEVGANDVVVLLSTNAGASFSVLALFPGAVDEPTVTTGPQGAGEGSVWLTFERDGIIVATGAPDLGLGSIGPFLRLQRIAGSANGNFGDIAVGSSGQVMVTYQVQKSSTLSQIFVNTDPTGLNHPKFGRAILATTTHVADFDYIPAMPEWGVDAEAGLAFDRSGGPFTGRVYLVYTQETPASSANTDILLRYSDDGGAVWSEPVRVNDDSGLNSQFMPRISLDDTTGDVAVGWYDCRNDLGTGGPGDTDGVPNDDAEYYATLITPQPDGVAVAPNLKVSDGTSNAHDSGSTVDFGDYTGLDFFDGVMHPLWEDNSDSTSDNPSGVLHALNAYTADVPASAFAAGSEVSLGGLDEGVAPTAALYFHGGANPGFTRLGNSYSIVLTYSASTAIDLASIGNSNLVITGPGGFSTAAQRARTRAVSRGRTVIVTYKLINPAGNWTTADNGTYSIDLQPGQVRDVANQAAAGGIQGTFAVAVNVGKGSHAGGTGFRN